MQKKYGVTFRTLPKLGGELRGVIVSADSEEHASQKVMDMLDRLEGTTEPTLRAEVTDVIATAELGFVCTAECATRMEAWSEELTDQQGSYFHISI